MLAWKAKLIEIGLAIALAYIGYQWIGHQAVTEYKASVAVAQAEADRKQLIEYNKVAQELEELKAKRAENAKVIRHTTERIISKEPIVYSAQCLSDDGMLVANQALSGSAPKPASEVPTSK